MKFIPSFGEFSTKGKDALKRFPITLIWAILGTFYTLYLVELELNNKIFATNILLTFLLGVSWLISARFFANQFTIPKKWICILPLFFLGLFYWHLPMYKTTTDVYWIRFILYLFSGHLFLLVAPFILKWDKNAYFNYLKTVFIAISRSIFFSLILYLGVILALAAFENLFNLDIKGKRYFQVFIICLGIVNTWIYLADFPKNIYQQTKIAYPKALEIFVKYILIPLVILYFIILYAYGFKILLKWNLPKGWVSYLVIALSFLGFTIQILISPIQKTIDSRAIRKFYPWFYRILIPLIGLLFVAIFKRISEYGFTEKRYFVLILAIWILTITLYMLWNKKKQIRVFPFSLSIITLIISVGFWSAFSIATKSQVHQFEVLYNQLKSKKFLVSFNEKQQFNSIIKYLGKKGELKQITPILGFNPIKGNEGNSYWKIQKNIVKKINLKVDTNIKNLNNIIEVKRTYFYIKNKENNTFNIKNYDYFKRINFSKTSKKETINGYNLSIKNNQLFIDKDNISYQLEFNKLINNLTFYTEYHWVTADEMTISKEFNALKIKVIFTSLNLIPASKKIAQPKFEYGNAIVMIKEK